MLQILKGTDSEGPCHKVKGCCSVSFPAWFKGHFLHCILLSPQKHSAELIKGTAVWHLQRLELFCHLDKWLHFISKHILMFFCYLLFSRTAVAMEICSVKRWRRTTCCASESTDWETLTLPHLASVPNGETLTFHPSHMSRCNNINCFPLEY